MAASKGIRAGKAYVEVFADNSKLVRGLRMSSKHIQQWGNEIRNIGLKLTAIGSAIALPLLKASSIFSEMGDDVAKMAKRTGLSVKAVSELGFVASQSGTDIENIEKSIRKMQMSIYDASRGLAETTEAFKALGLTTKDLQGLSPEEQFYLIAQKLSQVKDASLKAALASRIFGRAGTQLLPMLEDGVNGIDALRKKAQELGLVMSDEDVKSAEIWNDSLDALVRTLKMGLFKVGAALAPVLTKMADTFATITAKVNKFISENRGLVILVAQIAAGLVAAGLALTIFGVSLSGLGLILGKISVMFKLMGTAITFVLSPMGLLITALAGAVAAFVYFSDNVGNVIDWLKGKFTELYSDFSESISAMSNLLAQGDIAGAAKILWLLLKMEWQKGVNYINGLWLNFKLEALNVINDLVSGIKILWQDLQNVIVIGVIEASAGAKRGWANFFSWYAKTTEWLANKVVKAWMWVLSLFNENIDMKFVDDYLQKDLADKFGNIDKEKAAKIKLYEEERKAMRESANKDYEDALVKITKDYDKSKSKNDSDFAKQMRESQEQLDKAKQEWSAAVSDAKSKTTESASIKTARPDISSLGSLDSKVSTTGTFSSYALAGLGTGKVDVLISETQKTNRILEVVKNKIDPAFFE